MNHRRQNIFTLQNMFKFILFEQCRRHVQYANIRRHICTNNHLYTPVGHKLTTERHYLQQFSATCEFITMILTIAMSFIKNIV